MTIPKFTILFFMSVHSALDDIVESTLVKLLSTTPQTRLLIIDISQHHKLAEFYHITTIPILFIDNEVILSTNEISVIITYNKSSDDLYNTLFNRMIVKFIEQDDLGNEQEVISYKKIFIYKKADSLIDLANESLADFFIPLPVLQVINLVFHTIGSVGKLLLKEGGILKFKNDLDLIDQIKEKFLIKI